MSSQTPKPQEFFANFASLLGWGIIGTVLFIVLAVLLSPLLLVFAVWMMVMRFRYGRALKRQMQDVEVFVEDVTTLERKHIDVKVTVGKTDE